VIIPDEEGQIKHIPYAGDISNISDFKKIKISID
jgi:hypothetical protein